jgi:hypothetical protein
MMLTIVGLGAPWHSKNACMCTTQIAKTITTDTDSKLKEVLRMCASAYGLKSNATKSYAERP